MKTKSFVLLMVFITSLIPFYPGQAENSDHRTLEDAAALMYLSDALLLEELELDFAASPGGLFALDNNRSPATAAENIINRMIHASKMERNDLDANCRLLVSRYTAEGDDCEVKRIQSHCEQVRTKLTNRISLLRKLRGDRRKPLTKMWHSIKEIRKLLAPDRSSGRNFLRQVGPENFKNCYQWWFTEWGSIKESHQTGSKISRPAASQTGCISGRGTNADGADPNCPGCRWTSAQKNSRKVPLPKGIIKGGRLFCRYRLGQCLLG